MSTAHILILGAVAGSTIFLGMPIGRLQVGPAARAALSALATGILVFLLWDVLTGAVDPIESALDARHWGRFSWLAVIGVAGFTAGLMALVHYSEWIRSRGNRRATTLVGPGAAVPRVADDHVEVAVVIEVGHGDAVAPVVVQPGADGHGLEVAGAILMEEEPVVSGIVGRDRKSTRLNSSH